MEKEKDSSEQETKKLLEVFKAALECESVEKITITIKPKTKEQ